ncbi:aspartate beta-hydroxylase domain-containing protein 2 [Aplysia californica]|uniref:Aspartate beta-hydroxylase domain-containing protein 2 n=1 Tax=Aplysia californica TaxID=6500 RepID=A0ABM0K1D4_APLCA|nr:aspartate beta-hydroxylase domain-containing protein 2 [Aplysia californica]XP_005106462.1 aspartate beta-hydroxylase domain-containing protein 2 [Aplysia californica]
MDTSILFMFTMAAVLMLCVVVLEMWLKGRRQSGILTYWYAGFGNLWRYFTWCKDSKEEENTFESHSFRVKDNRQDSTSLCTSPNCIRCSRNLEILSTALTRLSYYITKSPNTEVQGDQSAQNEYHSLVADIKKSLDYAKNREGKESVKSLIPDSVSEASDSSSVLKSMPVESSLRPLVLQLSGLREQEFWPHTEFSALIALRQAWKHIMLEFVHLYKSPFPETQRLWKTNATVDGTWEIAQLVDQGRTTKAAEFCPLTMDLLKQIPDFLSDCYFGDASFSIVHPGTSIATHCGSTNCRIRCHLGLQVPQDLCTLTVGDRNRCWEEGEIICFDDAYPHSVRHHGGVESGFRAVFMIDLWHPDVSPAQREMIRYAFSP